MRCVASSRGLVFLLLLLVFLGPCVQFQVHAQAPVVLRLAIHDTIQPISAAYLQRGLDQAARDHNALVLISLDTPGGLLDSTRTMVSAMERSPVPVCVYISPTGARGGSAGFFLLEAADIAAMAPGTNAGASHPIVEGRTLDPILKQKIENDAAAFLRSIVTPRGRNTEAAEKAVRDSVSYSADEALRLHLIDLITPDEQGILFVTPGLNIRRFNGSNVHLNLLTARIQNLPPSPRERFLTRLTDPDLAIFLLLIGIFLLYLEFNVPGTIIPGALGALCILLALFGLNLLPLRGTSVALLVIGLALLLAEFKIPSHGVVASAGIVALIFGLATLVDAPIRELRVHPSTAIATGLAFGVITFYLGSIALRARRNKTLLGPHALVGLLAIVRSPLSAIGLAPIGQVEINGELWEATLPVGSASEPIGTRVRVREAHGLQLLVGPDLQNPAG